MKKALVLDDHLAHRIQVEWALEQMGFEVDALSSGEEALGLLKRVSYDLAILEWRAQSLGVQELESWISKELPDLPVFMITDDLQIFECVRWDSGRLREIAIKPLHYEGLEAKLAQWDLIDS